MPFRERLSKRFRKSKSSSSIQGSNPAPSNPLLPPPPANVNTRPLSSVGQIPSISSPHATSTPPGPAPTKVPQQTTPSGQTKTPWEKAIDQLSDEDRNAFNFANPDKRDTLLDVIQATNEKRNQCVEKQWKYRKQNGEEIVLREVVDGLLARLNKYAIIGDTAIQHNPDIVALAWAGFRFLLQIGLNDIETMANVLEALEHITHLLSRCAIYEFLYINNSIQLASAQNLAGSLQDLYTSVLRYLGSSKRYFGQNTAQRIANGIFNPYIITFQPLVDDLRDQESRVEKDARVAAEEFQHTVALGAEQQSSDQQVQSKKLLRILEDMRQPMVHIQAKVTEIHKSVQDVERSEILRWLSAITYEDHHSFIRSTRLLGTGEWLPQKQDFINWVGAKSSSILWLHGIAGAGKTKLASFVVDTIQNARSDSDALLYFYCNYKESERRDPEFILRALVKQISTMNPLSSLPEQVVNIYRERKRNGFGSGPLTLDDSKDLIIKLTAGFQQTVICIDALDECNKDTRGKLLHALEQILRSSTSLVKIFVTSRDDDDIVLHLDGSPNVYINSSDNSSDIKHFVTTEVTRYISEKKILRGVVRDELKESIISTVISGARGMFLWAHLQIMSICKEKTAPALERALTRLPTDLKKVFSEIWRRIEGQSEDSKVLAKKALKLILFAYRPLSRVEMLEALSAEPQARKLQQIDGLTEMTVLDVCQNLVVVDEKLAVLRFAHFSVEEFLRDHFEEPTAHGEIAEICLTLLCFSSERHRDLDNATLTSSSHGYPWDEENYADHYWEKHLSLSCNGSGSLMELQKNFFQPSPAFNCWCFRRHIYDENYWRLREMPRKLFGTPLMMACAFGLIDIFRHILSTICTSNDLNVSSFHKETALHFAARFGHSAIVNDLLKRKNLQIDARDDHGRTPLSWAAVNGHEEVVKLLLTAEGIDINSEDSNCRRTPLSLAARNGHEEVVKLLLTAEGIDINPRDNNGQTPLSWAAENGHEEVVKLLLTAEGIDINSEDIDFRRTPLSLAARNGHEEVVKLLLTAEGIDINSKDDLGRTPLSLAARNGHEEVVKLLLTAEGIDINSKGEYYGRTPLSLAAENGHEEAVKLLLTAEGIDINSKDNHGQTPLSLAAGNGHEEVVKLLLTAEGIDINSKDNYGHTPVSWAARNGHEEVVKLLLTAKGIDINPKDNNDLTPLSWAARNGHEEVVKLLLTAEGIDINSKDNSGHTPLSWAARNGHEEVVKLLLTAEGIDINPKDNNDLTPLSWAAENGHEEVVKLLLTAEGIDINPYDNYYGGTPLSLAARNGHEEVVKLLFTAEGIDINPKDDYGRTPLSWAARDGHEEVVKLLLTAEGIDINPYDNYYGSTPLSLAARSGREEVVKLLLTAGGIDINSKDNNGRTPLSWAAGSGNKKVVELLFMAEGMDINSKDNDYGRTPLSWAAENGHEEVVKFLAETAHVDSKDHNGQTPLSHAAGSGHGKIIKHLLANRKVDVNSKDESSQTPLFWAVKGKGVGAVKILLAAEGVDLNTKNKSGLTLLSRAAASGDKGIFWMLLEKNNWDINVKSNNGWTPLMWASAEGHEGVVHILLGTEGVDVNAADESGFTSLWLAGAHEEVVKLLLQDKRVDSSFLNEENLDAWLPQGEDTTDIFKLLETRGV